MYPTVDIKHFIREIYNASTIMTRSCYLSARGEVRNTDAVQICPSHMITGTIQEKGRTNFLHSLNINCYVISLNVCQIFLLLGLFLSQGSGDNAPKNRMCMQMYMQDTCSMYL